MYNVKPSQAGKEFAMVLQEWLLPEEYAEMRKRNARESDSGICHSHDFCDANMAMMQALENVGIPISDLDSEEDFPAVFWNNAWDYAKKHYLTEGEK